MILICLFGQAENSVNSESKESTHPLALLANRLRLVAEKEINVFFPVLRQLCPDSGIIAAMLLHQYYGEKLVCFVNSFCKILCFANSGFLLFLCLYILDVYFIKLQKPFLKEVSTLSDDVRSVLPAAYSLDRDLTHLFTSASKESRLSPLLKEDLDHYPVSQSFPFFIVTSGCVMLVFEFCLFCLLVVTLNS